MIVSNSLYANLPKQFYQLIHPAIVPKPELILFNHQLAEQLGLNFQNKQEIANFFAGNVLMPGSKPLALAYAGHQYGHFVELLGDGRAILLGEVADANGEYFEVQLKGAGKTQFSRSGDGKATLGPMLREYIVSEFMQAANIPTTRALAVVKTGEDISREKILPGAVLTRLAKSHLRIGSFEYFAALGDLGSVKILADYVIDKYYSDLKGQANRYQLLLAQIIEAQAFLIASWMQIGFIHGVMNTDNASILGQTIDYGPCAFMDFYEPEAVYSSIDRYGRYAYNNQAKIGEWNLAMLGQCLRPLLAEDKQKAMLIAQALISSFMPKYQHYLQIGMLAKIGIKNSKPKDFELAIELLKLMTEFKVDFTLCFRYLGKLLENKSAKYLQLLQQFFAFNENFKQWLAKWQARLKNESSSLAEIAENMSKVNPIVIPRNHLIEAAIKKAQLGNFAEAKNLIAACLEPFADKWERSKYSRFPKPKEIVRVTYCGT